MDLSRRAGFLGRSIALWAIMAMAVLCMCLAALGFLTAALLIWIGHYLGPASATAVTGLILLVLACLTAVLSSLVLRRMRARQPSLISEGLSTLNLGIRIATALIRRDPRKALLGALIAGAVLDYFTTGRQAKD